MKSADEAQAEELGSAVARRAERDRRAAASPFTASAPMRDAGAVPRDAYARLLSEYQALVDRLGLPCMSAEMHTRALTVLAMGKRELGIPDLHLHDMRREATSTLREMGFDREARKAITGHKSDDAHDIYVAVTLESLHDQYDAAQEKRQRPARRRRGTGHRP